MEVHNRLGRGYSENIYKDALQIELRHKNVPFQREQKFAVLYRDEILPHHYLADFVAYDKIILELKSVTALTDAHFAQTLNYMRVSGCRVGLLVNFNADRLEYERFVL
jgi:GxxExxY protein